MDEERILFDAQGVKIEGRLGGDCARGAVVITHPHPLYGGDMDNPVVESVARAYAEKGMATLRFNFRGVGRSQGRYDEGMGEQEDVTGAVAHVRELGAGSVDLAGYSFGAWVNARVRECLEENGTVMLDVSVDARIRRGTAHSAIDLSSKTARMFVENAALLSEAQDGWTLLNKANG